MTEHALRLKVKILKDGASIPTRGSALAAGYDLYACLAERVTIAPGQTVSVGTGLAMELPEGWFAAIFARSGLAMKKGLRPANCVGVCDADYRGEYIVPLYNDSGEPRTVENGERIAQMVLLPCRSLEFELADQLGDTGRGEGGFGSTGI